MKSLSIIVLLFFTNLLQGQIFEINDKSALDQYFGNAKVVLFDDFEDGNYLENPVWEDITIGGKGLAITTLSGDKHLKVYRNTYIGEAHTELELGFSDFHLSFDRTGNRPSSDPYDRGGVFFYNTEGVRCFYFRPESYRNYFSMSAVLFDAEGNITGEDDFARIDYNVTDAYHEYDLYKVGSLYILYEDGEEKCRGNFSTEDNTYYISSVSVYGHGSSGGGGTQYDDIRVVSKASEYSVNAEGLIAHYPFNGNAEDESRNGNDAHVSGPTLTSDRFGNPNSAYDFSGSGQYMSIPHIAAYNSKDITISCWFYSKVPITGTKGIMYKVSNTSALNREFGIVVGDTDGRNIIYLETAGESKLISCKSIESISEGEWYHMVGVISDNDKMQIFINGELDIEKKLDAAHSKNSNEIVIGKVSSSSQSDSYWNGKIDDIQIYNRSLNESEIKALYSSGSSSGGETIDIEFISEFVYKPELASDVLAYFYANVKTGDKLTPLESGWFFNLSTASGNYPATIKYMGNGLLQLGIDFRGVQDLSFFKLVLPEEVSDSQGNQLRFSNLPAECSISFSPPDVKQETDIFAGFSAGVALVQGVSVPGVSVAAASLSIEESVGVGLKFKRLGNGDQFITRKAEVGVALNLEAPSISSTIGDINLAKASAGVTAGIFQTMEFPSSLDNELILKAKSMYVLESTILGGMEISPFTLHFARALKRSLMTHNPDLDQVFADLYHSFGFGFIGEVSASVGPKFSFMDGKNFEIAPFGIDMNASMAINQTWIPGEKLYQVELLLAAEYQTDLLKLDGMLESEGLISFGNGVSYSARGQLYNEQLLNNLEVSFNAFSESSFAVSDGYTCRNYTYSYPNEYIIEKRISPGLIGYLSPFFFPSLQSVPFVLHPSNIVDDLRFAVVGVGSDVKEYEDYMTLLISETVAEGKSLDLNLNVAAGLGLKLGIGLSYLDQLTYPKRELIRMADRYLPVAEFDSWSYDQRLYTFKEELEELLLGTALLIEEPLKALEEKVEQTVEAGKEIAITAFDATVKIAGIVPTPGIFILKRIASRVNRISKSAFSDPVIINAFTSHNICKIEPWSFQDEMVPPTLYIISDMFNVTFKNASGQDYLEFSPVDLELALDMAIIEDLGFTQQDLLSAKLYLYEEDALEWKEQEGSLNAGKDTIKGSITISGTYAIGVTYSSSMDNTPLEIIDYYPQNMGSVKPFDSLWVQVHEHPVGSGVDLVRSEIYIDGELVESYWYPATDKLAYIPSQAYLEGEHSFLVNLYDNAGNYTNVISVFTVNATGNKEVQVLDNRFSIDCYPNPANETLRILLYIPGGDKAAELSLYATNGVLIGTLFNGVVHMGRNEFQMDLNHVSGTELPSGVYFIHCVVGQQRFYKKVVIQ